MRGTMGNAAKNKQIHLYNALVNVGWSVLCLGPVFVFCYSHVSLSMLYVWVGVSLLPFFFPVALLQKIQLSANAGTYKKIGVGLVQRFSQNGDLINRHLRKRFPGHKVVGRSPRSLQKLRQQTYAFEKFHLALLVFFGVAAGYAGYKGFFGWAALLVITNVVYNLYPVLLQQYIRLKLTPALAKFKAADPSANSALTK